MDTHTPTHTHSQTTYTTPICSEPNPSAHGTWGGTFFVCVCILFLCSIATPSHIMHTISMWPTPPPSAAAAAAHLGRCTTTQNTRRSSNSPIRDARARTHAIHTMFACVVSPMLSLARALLIMYQHSFLCALPNASVF